MTSKAQDRSIDWSTGRSGWHSSEPRDVSGSSTVISSMRRSFRSPTSRGSGFTIIELMAASAILLIVVTLSMYGFIYALKENARSMVQNELDMDVQRSMESLKKDLRLSALDKMFFYPLGSGSYSAVSFPLAYDSDGDGAVELGTNGKVIWDETVIFHVWKTSPNQLRRTRFVPRNNSLTDVQRQEQLNFVAQYGFATNSAGVGTHDWTNATTDVIFENLFDWSVAPQAAVYDGYAPQTNRDQAVSLGSCILSNGAHEFKFIVTGSNAASRGFKIGLDSLVVSPAGTEREAEIQPVGSVSAPVGIVPTNMLMAGGSWSHNRQLYFPSTATGQYFTLIVSNDCWEEVTFRGTGQKLEDTVVQWDAPNCPDVPTYDYVVRLDCAYYDPVPCAWPIWNTDVKSGWYAWKQTGLESDTSLYYGLNDTNDSLSGCAVRVLLRGEDMEYGGAIPVNSMGSYFYFYGGATAADQSLRIDKAFISECSSSNAISPDSLSTFHQLLFSGSGESVTIPYVAPPNNGTALGYCISPEPGGGSGWSWHRIDKKKSYLVTFKVSSDGNKGHGKYWPETRDPLGRGCWILPNATDGDCTAENWSANTNVFATNRLYCVQMMQEYGPSNGFFTSAILDTRKSSGVSNCVVSWVTNGSPSSASGRVILKLRGGTNDTLSDAPSWTNVTPITVSGSSVNLGAKRYIQFRAELKTSPSWWWYAPKLQAVRIAWPGENSYVDVGGTFTRGPDYGVWELQVDGQRLVRGITVNLEIFEDIYSRKGSRRVTSSLASEVTPRNSNK